MDAKENISWLKFTDAYGYFRPFNAIVFKILWTLFKDNVIFYHIFLTIIYIFCSIVIFNFILLLGYEKQIALLSVIFFIVLACHSEVIYSINSVNEMLSCLFLILGLYFFILTTDTSHGSTQVKNFGYNIVLLKSFVILFFTLALFSRESSISFIPLLFVVSIKLRRKINLWSMTVITIPLLIYFISLFVLNISMSGYSNRFNFNIFTITYKIIFSFTNTILPFKLISNLISEKIRENIIISFSHPLVNPPLFILELIILLLTLFLIAKFIRRNKSTRIHFFFTAAFVLSAYIVYLFTGGVSERFLFTPSVGIVLLIAVVSYNLYKARKKITLLIILLFIIFHSIALFYRANIYKNAYYESTYIVNNLYEQIKTIPENSNILLENFPSPLSSIDVLSVENFNFVWKYYYPDVDYNFYYNKADFIKMNARYKFDKEKLEFIRLN